MAKSVKTRHIAGKNKISRKTAKAKVSLKAVKKSAKIQAPRKAKQPAAKFKKFKNVKNAPNSKSKLKMLPKTKKTLKLKLKLKSKIIPKAKLKENLKLKGKAVNAKSKKLQAKITVPEAAPAPIKRELSKDVIEILGRAQARQWLIELGGENTLEVIRSLPAVPSDEELAKKLKVKVSDVRASLNKLHNEGLVAYLRDKNSETGWYSYSWEINEDRIKKWMSDKHAMSESFRPREGVDLYFCKDCGPESAVKFEIATESLFKCPSCNCALDLLDEEKFEQFRKMAEGKR